MPAPRTVPDIALAPRRRRTGRKLLVGSFVLLIGLAVLTWFAPVIVARTSLRDSVIRTAAADVNGTVTVGGLSLSWLQPVEITDLRVADPDGREVLAAPTIRTSNTLLSLALNRSDLGTVTVDKPTLTVTCGERTNLEDVFAKLLTGDSSAKRPAVALEIADGRVLLAEGTGTPTPVLERGTVAVTVPAEADKPVSVKASADAPDAGHVEATAALGSTVEVAAKADKLSLEGFGPLIRRFTPGTRLAGRATGDVTAQIGEKISVSGKANVAGLDLSASWIGPDRVRLARAAANLPGAVTIAGDTIAVGEGTELDCDVGKIAVSGEFSPSDTPEKILTRHGLKATADVDVAKLAAVIPRLLRLKEGTELTAGRVHAELVSAQGPRGTGWKGSVETTALKGTRAGKPLAWEKPFRAQFDAHFRPDGLPEFDDLQCQSDFVGLHARGTVREFVAAANLDLGQLSKHLNEFIDLGGVTLDGKGKLEASLKPDPNGGPSGLNAVANLEKFVFRDGAGREWDEPSLSVKLFAAGRFAAVGPIPVEQANLQVLAADSRDRLTVTLFEPVPDARTAHAGKVRVKLTGDMGRWRSRVGPFAGLPPEWAVAGAGDLDAAAELAADKVRCEKLTADLTGLKFRGLGLNVDEQQPVKLETGVALDRKTGAVTLTDVRLASETAGVSSRSVEIAPLPSGGAWGAKGTIAVTANVARVQRTIGLAADPSGADAVAGLANGKVGFDIGPGGVVEFKAEAAADDLTVGSPQRPVWVEKWVKVNAAGEWNPADDSVRCQTIRLERDGLTADGRVSVAKMSSPAAAVDAAGTLAYDLAKLEPQLRSVLGAGAKAVGKESKPFKLVGPIGSRPELLTGSAAVGWQELKAYGFEVGPGELKAGLENGQVRFSPVTAAFGGGTVEVAPTVKLDAGYDLSLAPGRVVKRAKLTPAVCASAVGFVLPPLANAAEVEGLISLDLGENTIPLVDPQKAAARGTLLVHSATVTAGPLITEIATALGAKNTAFTLTKEQAVPFRVENGYVYHESFTIMVEQTAIRTSGSVGLDGQLALFVDMQVPPRLTQQLFANNPVIREALAKQTLRFPIGGTLAKPKLEPGAFQAALRQVTRDATKEATGGFLRRGQDRLLQELEKKIAPQPEPK